MESQLAPFTDIRQRTSKPVMAILSSPLDGPSVQAAMELMGSLQAIGIPAFPGMERGALALRKAYEYWHLRE
jgi:hypothetical protein